MGLKLKTSNYGQRWAAALTLMSQVGTTRFSDSVTESVMSVLGVPFRQCGCVPVLWLCKDHLGGSHCLV